MSNESKVILLRLQQIEKTISDINFFTQVPDFSSLLNHLKLETPPDEMLEDKVFNQLTAELNLIENSILKTCLFILKKEADLYKIIIEDDFGEAPSVEQLTIFFEKFKNLIQERNIKSVEKLRQFKSQLPVTSKDQINQIDLAIKALEAHPTKLIVPEDEIDNLQKITESLSVSKELRKSGSLTRAPTYENHSLLNLNGKTKIAAISTESILSKKEKDELQVRNSLTEKYELFLKYIPMYSKAVLTKNDLKEKCQNDCLITKNRISLRDVEAGIAKLINTMKSSWDESYKAFQFDNHQSLDMELTEVLDKLKQLNKRKLDLKEAILKRQEYLLPPNQLTLNELTLSLKKDNINLRKTLEDFFKIFSTFKFISKEDKNSLFVSSKLKGFIDIIHTDLKHSFMPVNKANLDMYIDYILWHLGEEPILSRFKEKPKSIDETISNFLKETFEGQAETGFHLGNKEDIIRSEIMTVRSFTDQITLLSISDLKITYDLKTLLEEQEHSLIKKSKKIKVETSTLIKNLNQGILLLTNKYLAGNLRQDSLKIINKLMEFDSSIEQMFKAHVDEKKEFLKIPSALESSNKVVNSQKVYLEALKKMKDETYSPTGSHCIANNLLKKLFENYNFAKRLLVAQLTNAIEDARAALKIFKTDYLTKKILADATLKLNEINNSSAKIIDLENDINNYLEPLAGHVYETRVSLKNEYEPKLAIIENHFNQLSRLELREDNPFKPILESEQKFFQKQLETTKGALLLLGSCAPGILQQRVNNLNLALENINSSLLELNSHTRTAKNIDLRLNSPEYKTSIGIVETLKKEFLAISNKHIHKAVEKYKENLDKNRILDSPNDFLSLKSLSEDKISFLNFIDPRLYKLWSIRNEFEQINKDYIDVNCDFETLVKHRTVIQLKNECRQIVKAGIAAAIENNSSPILQRIEEDPPFIFELSKSIDSESILDLIDPRLYNLCKKIHLENQPTKHPLTEVQQRKLCINLLLDKVNTHLHNDHMEHFSDGKRSSFIQFIRLYIIKPLEIVKNMICSLFTKDNPNCFFTTPYACKTEATLVEKGNEATINLLAAASAA